MNEILKKKNKAKSRRTQDLISREVLLLEQATSTKKMIKKPRSKRNHNIFDDLFFDSGIKATCPEQDVSTASSSKGEMDFIKPVVNKRIKAIKTGTKKTSKVNCVGQSWLVESFTDVSTCSDTTRDNLLGEVSRKMSLRNKDSNSVQKNKPKTIVLENNKLQLAPCFVLLDKLNDESFKFQPSNSSSPFLPRSVCNLSVKKRNSSLTKEIFQELPNWSKSDYWNVNRTKAEDGSKSISNVNNSTYELNRPSLNGTTNLSPSKNSLKNTTFETDKPLDNSQTQLKRKSLIPNQSLTPVIDSRSTEKQETFVNITEDESKSVSNVNNSTYELNRTSMDDTKNLPTSNKSLKFEIEKSLNISRTLPKRSSILNTSLTASAIPTSAEKRKPLVELSRNLNGKKSLETSEKFDINSAINTPKSDEKLESVKQRRSTFTVDESVTNIEVLKSAKPERKKWVLSNPSRIFESLSRQSLGESSSNAFTKSAPLKKRQTFAEFTMNFEGRKSSLKESFLEQENGLESPPRDETLSKSVEETNSLTPETLEISNPEENVSLILGEQSRPEVTKRRRSILTLDKTVNFGGRKSSLFNKEIEESPAKFLDRKSGLESSPQDDSLPKSDGETNSFIFDRNSSEPQQNLVKFSDESLVFVEQGEPRVAKRRRSTLTLDKTVTDIEVLKSSCDLSGTPILLEKCEQSDQEAKKKRRCVTFNEASVIMIDDSATSFEQVASPTPEDVKNGSYIIASTASPYKPRHRISSDSSLYKKSVGLNHNICQAEDNKKTVASASKSKIKKMPDFAKIHQNLFNKMLDIREYSAKKNERAKLLLSGKKQPKQLEKIKSIVTKKQLFPSLVPASTTPNLVTSTPKVIKPTVGYTRFGLKVPQRTVATKEEQRLAVANKKRPINPSKQRFKEELKGVRSNKRFELLMKMRQK